MPDEPVGSVAEETARLLAALGIDPASSSGSTGTTGTTGSGGSAGSDGHEHPHVAAGDAVVCSLCPVCQAIALARTVNPELLDRLADLAALAAQTLREIAVAAAARPAAASPDGAPASTEGARRRPRSGAVDIPVADDRRDDPTGPAT